MSSSGVESATGAVAVGRMGVAVAGGFRYAGASHPSAVDPLQAHCQSRAGRFGIATQRGDLERDYLENCLEPRFTHLPFNWTGSYGVFRFTEG